MDEKSEDKLEFKEKFISFYKSNRIKVYIFITILILSISSLMLLKFYNDKKNNLISDKFVQAGLFLANNKKSAAKQMLEEIILSKNKFYSILSLNMIIEKELITDKNKIIEYFNIVEKSISSKERKDLLNFKKALYLIKTNEIQSGNSLLKKLVENDSMFKSAAKELLEK